MAKKEKKRKIKFSKILLTLIILGLIGFGIYYFTSNRPKPKKVKKNLDSINGYNYTLNDRMTNYDKTLFKQLKNILEKDDVNEEEYANTLTKLFVSDLFTLDNKINHNDVGGKQFVYSEYQDSFVKYAGESIYKNVETNIDGKRKQDLPVVTEVTLSDPKTTTFKYSDKTDTKAIEIPFKITYKEDLGYQTSGYVTLIHNGKKLEVAKLSDKES